MKLKCSFCGELNFYQIISRILIGCTGFFAIILILNIWFENLFPMDFVIKVFGTYLVVFVFLIVALILYKGIEARHTDTKKKDMI